ncbi:MAG: hypothetical protein ACQEXB_11165 [Bacillota bacterium]
MVREIYNDVYGAWRSMEELQSERAIVIADFTVVRAVDLSYFNEVTPAINPPKTFFN